MDDLLVLDSDTQSALALVRSLGRRDVRVTAGSSESPSLGMVSKFSDGRFVYPDPRADSERFVRALRTHLEANDYFAVFPVSDHTTALISRHKQDLQRTGTAVAAEDWDRFETTYDKAETFSLVADLDVPAPRTLAPESHSDLADRCDALEFPVVVKSRSKSVWGPDGRLHLFRVFPDDYVHTGAELLDRYRSLVDSDPVLESHLPIVQEVVDGRTTTTTVLADDGEILAYFQERRLRTYPADGGNSTLLDGIHDERMLEYARTLIGELGWTGPAQVEFMRTPEGDYRLIEVNGRYWGSLPLAITSGVDYPWLHYRLLRGDPVDRVGPYRTDVVQRRLLYGDIKWLVEQLSARNVGALAPFVRDFFTSNHTFFSAQDPAPTVLALKSLFELGLSTLTGRQTLPHRQW